MASTRLMLDEGSSFFSQQIPLLTPQSKLGFWKSGPVADQGSDGKQNHGVEQQLMRRSMVGAGRRVGFSEADYANRVLSGSLPGLLEKKLAMSVDNVRPGESFGAHSNFDREEPFESMEEIEAQTIGNLLPDDDDLLFGVNDVGDIDDDIFYSGGGIELETDGSIGAYRSSEFVQQEGLNGTPAGEHPFSEHPSRTLFVRNINSNVDDVELKALFEQYGDIRTLYTACKHRGFVMISYYDIRSARNAMKALQNKPLRRRKLDIHYSIPKENPSDKDVNQGTLVVFNLDPSVSNDELLQIFGIYGEIKEIRETPHKRHHKFIEFYDIRAAEAALDLNKTDIAGKKIKVEPSRPGGAKRTLVQQLSSEIELDEINGCNQGSPIDSQNGYYGFAPMGPNTSNSLESGGAKNFQPAVRPLASPFIDAAFEGIASSVSQTLSSPIRISSAVHPGNLLSSGDLSHSLGQMNLGYQGMGSLHPHSLPEYHNRLSDGTSYNSSNILGLGLNTHRTAEAADRRHIQKSSFSNLQSKSFDLDGAFGISSNESGALHEYQYSLNNSNAFQHQVPSSMPWPNSPSFMNNISPHRQRLPRAPPHMMSSALPLHHVGSAPSVNPTPWEKRHAHPGDAANSPSFHPGSLGGMGFLRSSQLHQLELASRNIFPHARGSCPEHSMPPAHIGVLSPQQRSQIFHGKNNMVHLSGSFDSPTDRIRSRRNDSIANQSDNKKQYELDIDRIVNGEDSRTTLMIKNIPNKYSIEMILLAIDESHRGTYDFIYLPIDFKNNCNVGYAFINMISPEHIVSFYQKFNGKKWEKFNSEKVASLAYARIQGKQALTSHFQNSSLMNEDKRCRPILFYSGGPNAGDQEPFPMGAKIRSRPGRSKVANGSEEQRQENPFTTSPEREASSDAVGIADSVV